jgi:hypothetical protein
MPTGHVRPATEAVCTAPPALSATSAARVKRNGSKQVGRQDGAPELIVETVEIGGAIGSMVAEVPALLTRSRGGPAHRWLGCTTVSAAPGFDIIAGAAITHNLAPQALNRAAPRASSDRSD